MPALDIDLNSINPIYRIGYGFNINNYLAIALMYSTYQSVQEDLGAVPTTGINPDTGNVEVDGSLRLFTNFSVNSFTLPIVIRYSNYFQGGVNISALHYRNKVYSSGSSQFIGSDIDEIHIVPNFGFIISPTKVFSFGGTYIPEYKISNTIIPKKIRLGSSFTFYSWQLFFDGHYTNASVTQSFNGKKIAYYQDKINIHFGLSHQISPAWLMRIGVFTKKDIRKERITDLGTNVVADGDQVFMTIGSSLKFQDFSIHFSWVDSRLLSSNKIKQTFLNLGISLDL